MRSPARLTRLVSAAALGLGVTAVPVSAPSASADGLMCRVSVIGLTGTDRLMEHKVVNGKIVETTKARTPLPYSPSALALKSSSVIDGVPTLGILAIHPSGTPRVIKAKFWRSPTTTNRSIVWSSRTWNYYHFLPRLITGYGGDGYYYVNSAGHLARRDHQRAPQGVGTGYSNLTALQWALRYQYEGRSYDILYATTDAGALVHIRVPVEAPWNEMVTTLKDTGYESVTELSVGRCNKSPYRHSIVAITPGSGATWTTVDNVIFAQPVDTTLRGPVQDYIWAVHSVF